MKFRKLQGIVISVDKTEETQVDHEGQRWQKCIFTLELERFSNRTPEERVPPDLEGKKVKIVRWCYFDWHYKTGVRKTLEADETEDVIAGRPTASVYW